MRLKQNPTKDTGLKQYQQRAILIQIWEALDDYGYFVVAPGYIIAVLNHKRSKEVIQKLLNLSHVPESRSNIYVTCVEGKVTGHYSSVEELLEQATVPIFVLLKNLLR